MINTSFKSNYITHSDDLERTVREGIAAGDNHYYFFINDWDKDSLKLQEKFNKLNGEKALNIISIWNIPNAVQVIKSVIKEEKESMSVAILNEGMRVPSLLVLHGAFARLVTYSGSYFAELNLH
jgi:hypothetical protein